MSSEKRSNAGRIRRLFRKLNVRLTFWFTAVFLFTSLAIFGLTFANTYRTLRADDQQTLRNRAFRYLVEVRRTATEGEALTQLSNAIQGELPSLRGALVRVADQENHTIFIGYWPTELEQEFDFDSLSQGSVRSEGFVTLSSDVVDYDLEFFAVQLPSPADAYVLQVGADTSERVRILRVFQRSFVLIFIVLLALSVIGGLLFVSRTLRPLGALNATIRGIVDTGNLTTRIPSRNTNDDLDDLVGSFNLMLDQIQRLVLALRDTLDSVAHDLRTPMTRFRTIAENALSAASSGTRSDAVREALSDALEESDQILTMLNAMMDISEAESGAMRLTREEVDLMQLCRKAAEVYAVVAEESSMRIVVDSGELPAVVDTARMRQVIGNLLDNAIKYGRQDTTITICGAQDSSGPHPNCCVSVTNHGLDIPEEQIGRIWDRLYRGATGGTEGGLGLGLTLVKAITEAHGGSVSVASRDGETRFQVCVPRR
jgi:signal transduction histidine kinase